MLLLEFIIKYFMLIHLFFALEIDYLAYSMVVCAWWFSVVIVDNHSNIDFFLFWGEFLYFIT